MRNLRRVVAVAAAGYAALSLPLSGQAKETTCDETIYWDGQYPEYGPWWDLQYECGEGHPQDGCYREIGGPQYLAFDCSSGSPSMMCDAGGCFDTK